VRAQRVEQRLLLQALQLAAALLDARHSLQRARPPAPQPALAARAAPAAAAWLALQQAAARVSLQLVAAVLRARVCRA
jgi:hypothetical protein